MPKAVATIQWDKCHPEQHADGTCSAAQSCPHRVLKQDSPGEPPVPLGPCRGCGLCVAACPEEAVKLM